MKFFKHFVDARDGKSMRAMKRKLGMAGFGQWWELVALCAEAMEKEPDEKFTEAHCEFEFDLSRVAEVMGTKQRCVRYILGTFQECELISAVTDGFIVRIKMPKLLESLDRDTNRARTDRDLPAPKKKIKNKDKEEDKEYIRDEIAKPVFDFDRAFSLFPGKQKGPEAEKRFADQIQTTNDFADLLLSLKHYNLMLALPENDWRSPKTTFETYLGTKKKPFWRDFVAAESCKPSSRASGKAKPSGSLQRSFNADDEFHELMSEAMNDAV